MCSDSHGISMSKVCYAMQAVCDGNASPPSPAPAAMDAVSETSGDSDLDADVHGGDQSPLVPDTPQDGGSVPHTPAHQTPEVRSILPRSYITAR